MDLTEAEDIQESWQEYTELYKKDLDDPDNHNDVITLLNSDILECEVKWALESITRNKASGSDGIPVELFQILKDDAVKVLHSISSVQLSCSVVSDSLRPHESQHARPPCPSPTPRVHSDWHPSSQ